MFALSAVVLNTHGTGALLIAILIDGLIAALVYWLLSLFAPHPIPVLVAVLVFLILLLG